MTLQEAKTLKTGDYIHNPHKFNADKTPMRARITSIKTWKRDHDRMDHNKTIHNHRVELTYLGEWHDGETAGSRYCRGSNTYVAGSLADCRDETDRAVYRLVCQTGDTITIGRTIGRLAFGEGWTKP
jgi:hypothetical protein